MYFILKKFIKRKNNRMGKLRYLITCWVGVSLPCFKKVSVYLLARLSLWTLKGVTLRKAFTKYFTLAWFCCQSFWLHWPWCFSAHTQYAFQLILSAWVGFRRSVPVAGLLWNESFCFAHFKEVQAGANDKSLCLAVPCRLRGCKNRPTPFPCRML